MAKTCKFKLFVDNVSDASIKLNNVERSSIETNEGTLVKWVVSKEGYQSDMGEITLESSCTVTVRLAKANARVKNTYTKIYKDEDGKYVTEQSELTTTGRCLPSSDGQEGKVLSVTEGGFVNWVESSSGDLSELIRKVNSNTTAIEELDGDVDSLGSQLDGVVSQIETKANASDLESLSDVVGTKADASALSNLAEEVAADKKNLSDNYWNSAETSNQIESASEAVEATLSVTINQKANKATTLAGYNITDAYTKDEIDAKASSFMNYKGQVENTNALPSEASIGDVYNVKSTGANYCWNGESWDKLSEDIDLSGLMSKEEARAELALKANAADVESALALKANKSELPVVPTNVSAFTNDAGYLTEHQSLANLATKAELQDETNRAEAAEALKANQADMEVALNSKLNRSEILTGDGYLYNKVNKANGSHSLIFNESDGGGSQFYNKPANVISYVGVNEDNADGVCVQIYSKYKAEAEGQTANKGTRLNINPNGMYYTNGKTNGSFAAEDELATKGELNLKATLEDVNSLSDQLRILNDRLSEMSKTNKETVAPIAGEPVTLNDATKDYTIESDFDKTFDVVAKSVEIKDATITAVEKLPSPKGVAMLIEASEEVAMKNSTVDCNLTDKSNIVEVRNCQYITFRDMTFTGHTYNTIMTGQRSPNQPIKSLTIENCEFKEFADHVNIWAANFADNAVVTINNCHFYNSDEQVLALSNETLAKNVTINITNCIIDKCETGNEYEGFILCQDYISKSQEAFESNAMFKNMTINLSNVTLRGVKLTKENFKMGTSAAGQCLYVYGPTLHAYDERFFPTVNVM